MLLAGITIAGGLYKWVDEHGTTVYSDTAPPGKASQQVEIAPQPPKEVLERAQKGLDEQRQRREQPQEVLGSLVLGFAPTALANLPEPPISLTMVIKSLVDGSEFKFKLTDPSPEWKVEDHKAVLVHQSFAFSLRPGSYKMDGVEVRARSLSDSPFLLLGGAQFDVPEGNCVYIGRLGLFHMRLPPGSLAETQARIERMWKERSKSFILVLYLPKGPLICTAESGDIPDEAGTGQFSAGDRRAFERARDKNCAIQLAKYRAQPERRAGPTQAPR
jgi:hypothetical protein